MEAHVENYKGLKITVEYDEDTESPRSDMRDNLGTMLYTSNRYILGDKKVEGYEIDDVEGDDSLISLPVYAYIHSGTVLNTTGFSCPWDSGKCGIIYISKDKALKEWGRKRMSAKFEKKVEDLLRAEVQEYSDFCAGECYGYTVTTEDGTELEACWGFIGDLDYVISEAKSVADYHALNPETKEVA